MGLSEACERNKKPIFERLKPALKDIPWVWEIGSGTGQHIIYFATQAPSIEWQPSDVSGPLNHLSENLNAAALPNIRPFVEFESGTHSPPFDEVPFIYTANTLHIMSWEKVGHLFQAIGKALKKSGTLAIYGPFNYGNQYTSESNQAFDAFLKNKNPSQGIRNFEDVIALAKKNQLSFVDDYPMPANNRFIYWRKA